MSNRNLPGPARKADNLTAICEPTVYKMSDPRRLNAMGLYGLLCLVWFILRRSLLYLRFLFFDLSTASYSFPVVHFYDTVQCLTFLSCGSLLRRSV
jgi:hypothetical protein